MRPPWRCGAVRAALLAAVVVTVGCDSLVGPETRRVLGTIDYVGDEPRVTVPETVDAGEPFEVSVVTVWPGLCAVVDETEVRATTSLVDVIPWDRVEEDDCPAGEEYLEHTVTLSRATPAVLTVTIHGRRLLEGGGREEVRIHRQVVVREP